MAEPRDYTTAYIVKFAAAICVVCSVVVATSAVILKPKQVANKIIDRQKKVLVVANLMEEKEGLTDEEIRERYTKSIKTKIINLSTGEYAKDVDGSTFDQRKASKKPETSKAAPANLAKVMRIPNHGMVYHVVKNNQVEMLIIPIEGYGLWSTLYGFLALSGDTKTIRGITFYEHLETPGLGGEVDNPRWKALWDGRLAFDENWDIKIQVIKGVAGSASEDPFHVDGLSGASITSRGVTNMLSFWLGSKGYGPYLKKYRTTSGAS